MNIYKWLVFFFMVVLMGSFSAVSISLAEGKAEGNNLDIAISMDIRGKPLRGVLEDISERTGYHVEVSDNLLDIPISGNFKNTTLTELLGRVLKGRNVFILEDNEAKLITVRTTLSEKEKVTTIFVENDTPASAENYSLRDLQEVQKSLDKTFNDNDRKIESSPGVLYQEVVDTQQQLDQKLDTTNGKSEVEASPEITYQELLDTQGELNSRISKKNSGVKAASGVAYNKVSDVQKELDTQITSGESTIESSPGVSYKKLLVQQLKLDKQLAVRN
ncbi:MAG TPA: hypothetical protein ENJ28_10145 [Gammaproteobacteria bacterium]|nr:hypothetical protein [Gammaproteobacteria bacterium]